jgi:hypothetical protein
MLDPENLEDPLFNWLTVELWMALGHPNTIYDLILSEKKLFLTDVLRRRADGERPFWSRILPKLRSSWRHLNQLSRSQSSTLSEIPSGDGRR